MKTIINKIFLASALTLSLSACSDFLEKEPLSQGTEAIVFKTPEHFVQAANALYNMEGWKNYDNKANYDVMDRNLDISGLGSNGGGSASHIDDTILLGTHSHTIRQVEHLFRNFLYRFTAIAIFTHFDEVSVFRKTCGVK